jgi:hypothetical protein
MPLALSVAVQVAAEAKVRCDAQLSHGVVFLDPAMPTADRLLGVKAVLFLETPRKFLQTDRLRDTILARRGGVI